jgi:hypothetical protein
MLEAAIPHRGLSRGHITTSKRSPPMAKPPTNIAASVRARLLNLARRTNQPFDVLLTRFVHERLLSG